MKGFFMSLSLMFSAGLLFGQNNLVITAVYDGPLSGGFPKGIELYATDAIADLSTYGIGVANNGGGTDGQEYTFPADAIAAGEYLYITPDAAGFMTFFGFAANYIDNIMNVNGDDPIEIYNNGAVVDVYGNVADDGTGEPWEYLDGWAARLPGTGPDGDTFVLGHWTYSGPDALDGSSNNASADTPVPVKTYDVAFSPDATVVASNFQWTPADITIEAGQVIEFSNAGGFHNVDGSIATYPNNPEGFFSGPASNDLWVYNFAFNIPGSYDFQCNPHAANGMVGTITVNAPAGPTYTPSTIASITTVDAAGVPDSINATSEITGTVYGIDFSGNSTATFTVIDATGGIGVFTSEVIGYNVTEGDNITIKGEVGINNGLTRISADELVVNSTGNNLIDPLVITTLDESTESEFIRINNLTLMDPTEWTGTGGSFTANATDGTNMFAIRVDSDSEVADRPAPPGTFDIIGLGSQFDTSSPYEDGYQIFPRVNADVILQGGAEPIAADDELNLALNENGSINVVLNDFVPGTFGQITVLTTATLGQTMVMDSTISYFPLQDECGSESLEYELCNTDGICDTATLVVNIECPPSFPEYDIATVTTLDGTGQPDSIGRDCQLTGIVYGVNLRPNGLLFTIIDKSDENAGIVVFNNTGDLGYTVIEGDEITVQGSIGFFNGLTQINADNVVVESQGNGLFNPAEVTALNESTESKLVKITGLTVVDETDWTNAGSGFNVRVTDNVNEYIMRVDADVNIFGTTAPTMVFTLTGLGGQYDEDSPYDSGYQLTPRYLEDIDFGSDVVEVLDLEHLVNIYPNPAQDWIQIESDLVWETIRVVDVNGSQVMEINSFDNNISIRDLNSGHYQLMFINKDKMGTKKLTIIR